MNASAVILNVFCSAFILLATLWVCIIDGVECWEESRWKRILHKFSRKERKNEMTRHQSGKGVNSRPHSNVRLKISLDFHIQPKSKTKHQAKKKTLLKQTFHFESNGNLFTFNFHGNKTSQKFRSFIRISHEIFIGIGRASRTFT